MERFGPVVGRRVVRADHREAAAVAFPAQHVRGREPGGASPDDHDRGGLAFRARRLRRGARQLLPDDERVAVALDAPAADRVERGRAEGLPGAQAEAGVVPRAAHGVADDDALGERAVIVRAGRAHGEVLVATPREQHGLVVDVPQHHAAVRNVAGRDSALEIGPARGSHLGHLAASPRTAHARATSWMLPSSETGSLE